MEQNVPLSDKTSFRIGGPARFYIRVLYETAITEGISWANERSLPIFVLGGGSNILVSDSGWQGLVLDLSGFSKIKRSGEYIICSSGALIHDLVTEAVNKDLGGIEELAGIPGSIGGAVIMNAGAFTRNISDCLVRVRGINLKTGVRWEKRKEEIGFGYRYSSLKDSDELILTVAFSFTFAGALKERYNHILRRRSEKQPLEFPNCGSVFKRPDGGYAGALIERAGLKGLRIGDVSVSEKHANFFQNLSGAKAEDVRGLIAVVQKAVFEHSGILLEPELVFVGDFNTPLFTPP